MGVRLALISASLPMSQEEGKVKRMLSLQSTYGVDGEQIVG